MIRPAVAGEVDSLVAAFEWLFAPPGSRPRQWDPGRAAARLRRAIESDASELFVADEDVRVLDGLDTGVGESDTLVILPAMAGG